jgi:hypothetical protein
LLARLEDAMKALRIALALPLLAALAFAGDNPKTADTKAPAAPANPAFEKIKSLAGQWQGKTPEGKTFTARFRVVSSGSAVVIDQSEGSESDMITVIHPDGANLMATHYCGAKNQPRYVATAPLDANVISFKFKDVTNLATPDAGYMAGVTFTFPDPDHHTEEWTWRQGGKDQTFKLEFARVK